MRLSSRNRREDAIDLLSPTRSTPAGQQIDSLAGTHRPLAISSSRVRFGAAFGPVIATLFLLLPAAIPASCELGMRVKGARALHTAHGAVPAGDAVPGKGGYGGTAELSDKPRGKKAKSPAPAGFGQLVVVSNPSGAKIKLDGQSDPAWTTPYTFAALQPGAHLVTVSKEHYATWEEQVEVHGGQKDLRIELVGLGEIAIMTIPPQAEVVIDGRSYGPSPVRATLKEGLHTYEVRFAGMPTFEKSVVLKGGMTFNARVTLGSLAAAQPVNPSATSGIATSGIVGHILRARGDTIAIDLGSKNGLRTGSRLSVYKANNANVQVGELEVIQILNPDESEARIVNMKPGFKLESADLVRVQ